MWFGSSHAGEVFGEWFGAIDADGGWVHYPAGGLALSGAAATSFTASIVAAGGLVLSGEASVSNTWAELPAGGFLFGGSASIEWESGAGGEAERQSQQQLRVVQARTSAR